MVPVELARKHKILPLRIRNNVLEIALANPGNMEAQDEITFVVDRKVKVFVDSEEAIIKAISFNYQTVQAQDAFDDFSGSISYVKDTDDESDEAALRAEGEKSAVVELVNKLLLYAIRVGASDIHLEPFEHEFRIRLRLDGRLKTQAKPKKTLHRAVTSRLKILAEMNIAERRLPQDGRIKMNLEDGREVDFRVASIPTAFGEKMVLRVLDKSRVGLNLNDLGLDDGLNVFQQMIRKPQGMILVTGPTGSGKTTTLAAALTVLNQETDNIMTIEDPIEIPILGINQIPINEATDLTFAKSLRSILRLDPDIIMVGEIRDFETAEIAIKAALTGHLVLSTLHTNNSTETISRLLQMGIEPYLLAGSLQMICAQRLVRRICSKCMHIVQRYEPGELVKFGFDVNESQSLDLKVATGQMESGHECRHCGGTGFKGRVALYEILVIDEMIRTLMVDGANSHDLRKAAKADGLVTLKQDGLNKVRSGLTTLEEVFRVTVDS